PPGEVEVLAAAQLLVEATDRIPDLPTGSEVAASERGEEAEAGHEGVGLDDWQRASGPVDDTTTDDVAGLQGLCEARRPVLVDDVVGVAHEDGLVRGGRESDVARVSNASSAAGWDDA